MWGYIKIPGYNGVLINMMWGYIKIPGYNGVLIKMDVRLY
jgi:hypothetical protein